MRGIARISRLKGSSWKIFFTSNRVKTMCMFYSVHRCRKSYRIRLLFTLRHDFFNEETLFDRLQKFHNRGARVLTFSRYDADANRLLRQLNWKDLSTQFQIRKALMVYKSFVPGYLSSKFVKRYETRYSLRGSVNKLIVDPFP